MARDFAAGAEAAGRSPRIGLRLGQRPKALTLYFDTSALIKLVLLEQGSDLALELWARTERGASSVLAYPEGCAALAAAHRSKRLTPQLYRDGLQRFDQVYAELIAVGVDEQLTRAAGICASEFRLCGYDAVHLATAMDLAEDDVAVVTWDRDLARAALEVGLTVVGE